MSPSLPQSWCQRTGLSRDRLMFHARGAALTGDIEPPLSKRIRPWPDYNKKAARPYEADRSALHEVILTRAELDRLVAMGLRNLRLYQAVVADVPNGARIAKVVGRGEPAHMTDDELRKFLEDLTGLMISWVYRDNKALLLERLPARIVRRGNRDVGRAYQDFHLVMALLDRRIEPTTFAVPPPGLREQA